MTSVERGPAATYDLEAVKRCRREVDAAVRAGVEIDALPDELSASLNREATVAKAAGDWVRAVQLLQRAKALAGESYHDTRLAKFLQYAGRAEDALAEIEWLLERSLPWAKSAFGHRPTTVVLEHHARWCSSICRDAAAICRRSSRPDLQMHYEQRWGSYFELVEKLREVNEAHDEARRKERESVRESGRQAQLEFHEKMLEESEENRRRHQEGA